MQERDSMTGSLKSQRGYEGSSARRSCLLVERKAEFHMLGYQDSKQNLFTCDGTKCEPKDATLASDPLDGGTLDVSIVTRGTGRCGNLFPVAFSFSICLSFSRPSINKM